MPQCQFLFSIVLCFRKVTQEIFSELDKTKAKLPIFPDTRQGPKQRWRRALKWPHHLVAPPPSGHARVWCGPLGHPLTSPFRLYNPFDAKNLNHPAFVQENFHSVAAIEDQFWGTEVSVPAPCRDRELPPEPSSSTPPPSPSTLLSRMMRRE
jgi:hypothetical protein